MPPPPTPASLADLPGPWLLKLAGSDSFKEDSTTLWRLSRSCSLFRDLVLRQRKATARFSVPIVDEDFPEELQRLCTLARSSSNIRLEFWDGRGGPRAPWTETEPQVTHLLLCAMAQLGGQPLTGVKEVKLQNLEHTSPVPMWLPLVCPNVTVLSSHPCTLTEHLPLRAPPAAQRPSTSHIPPTVALPHLQDLTFIVWEDALSTPQAQHLQQQLAALPSLTRLQLPDSATIADGGLHSTSVTRLCFKCEEDNELAHALRHLPAQLPSLVELDAQLCLDLEDGSLEALLSLHGTLRRVHIFQVHLERSHAHRPCAWEELSLGWLHVGSVARLPLEGIQRLCWRGDGICPSRNAQAVARVAAAVKRSGGLGAEDGFTFSGEDPSALLTTLRPLLEALPAEEQHKIIIENLGEAATPGVVQQLGQQLPPGVHTLYLIQCDAARDAWAAVLPSLPATVTRLELEWSGRPAPRQVVGHVVALCAGAVRPITVSVRSMRAKEQRRIRRQLTQQGNTRVTLLFE